MSDLKGWGGCLVVGGYLVSGGRLVWGCGVLSGGGEGSVGVLSEGRGCLVWRVGVRHPRDAYCRGQYPSYWNAFLLKMQTLCY